MRHRLAILAAALLWSTSGFFVKSPTLSAIEPLADRGLLIAGWRSFFAALASHTAVGGGRWAAV